MEIGLRIAQVLLAATFLLTGFMKAFRFEQFAASSTGAWARDLEVARVRAIGLVEIAGAIGLIVPASTRILPWLTPLAAACLAVTMVAAAAFNVRQGEAQHIPLNVVLGAMSAYVAIGLVVAGLA